MVRHLFLVIAAFLVGNDVSAEWECRSELSYKWKKAQEEAELEVKAGSVSVRGADELATKRSLNVVIEREQKKVREQCKREHENVSGCVAAKFASLEPTMQRLSFSQRRSLEEAVTADCSAKQGSCSAAVASPVVCEELKTAEQLAAEAAAAADPKAGKKDAKKK